MFLIYSKTKVLMGMFHAREIYKIMNVLGHVDTFFFEIKHV